MDEDRISDAGQMARVESAAQRWEYRIVVNVDLKDAGPQIQQISEGLGAAGGEVFKVRLRRFFDDALASAQANHDEGIWDWTGDGALLAFADANRAHEFAVALHRGAGAHSRAVESLSAKRIFRVGMASTDDPAGESWSYTVMRVGRLQTEADAGGILIDVKTKTCLPSAVQSLYGSEKLIIVKGLSL